MTDLLNFIFEPEKKKKILIDFAGVLTDNSKNRQRNYLGPIRSGAEKFLKELSKKYEIKIFTTKNKIHVAEWILNQGLDRYVSDITNIKEKGTFLFISNNCICFDGNFDNLKQQIKNFKIKW